ncbi:acyltransferase [uncultured Gimesia sp.]|uniref:acyltransferase family protein n=1 Tax=uncultured Gimesia sp. TaxID=1678688 RepID=UPI0030DB4F27|tara:strand:- start:3439 stop:4530 length:1092 start_codon:yes stop_codon:yes gene_type:complete
MDLLPLDHPRLKKNNFDLLRLLLAMTVCLVHAAELSDFASLNSLSGILSAKVAVQAFFVVSGFLIVMSYERSSSLTSYASKRLRRIYPAYFTVVLLCALGLVLVSQQPLQEYFSLAWLKYLVANLTFLNFLQPTLPGVFESNRLAAVNGALWTLKIEVLFYVAVPLLVYCIRRFRRLPVLLFFYCLSVAYAELMTFAAVQTGVAFYERLARQLPGQLSYFMAGAILFYYLPFFERRIGYLVSLAVGVLTVNFLFPLPLLQPFALATLVLFFGLFLYAGNFGKYGDFSYGVYILHFPVIQILLISGWFRERPWYFLFIAVSITLIGAILMWNLVEKRFLLRSSHYVGATAQLETETPVKQPASL